MSVPVIVIGAGGHARVVADALRGAGSEVLGFVDADWGRHGAQLDGLMVLGGDEMLATYRSANVLLANGIGSIGIPTRRRAVHEALAADGWRFTTVIHPRATVSPHARLEEGAQVMAGAVVQPGAVIGVGCIVNTGSVVDHDCVLGAHCHVAPGATLSGEVHLGAECHVGTGAVVVQSIRLGARTLIGAGAVVVRDHPGAATLVGVPAQAQVSK